MQSSKSENFLRLRVSFEKGFLLLLDEMETFYSARSKLAFCAGHVGVGVNCDKFLTEHKARWMAA